MVGVLRSLLEGKGEMGARVLGWFFGLEKGLVNRLGFWVGNGEEGKFRLGSLAWGFALML